jgi:hypothetical protein
MAMKACSVAGQGEARGALDVSKYPGFQRVRYFCFPGAVFASKGGRDQGETVFGTITISGPGLMGGPAF